MVVTMSSQSNSDRPTQRVRSSVRVVMMEVDPAHEEQFNRWYNDQHLPERLEIPGYVSSRRSNWKRAVGF